MPDDSHSKRSLVFRIARRLVGEYDRRRPYPIKERIWQYVFPNGSRDQNADAFLILTTASYLSMSAWTAASFFSYSPLIRDSLRIVFAIQGPFTTADRDKILRTFPNATVIATDEIVARLRDDCPRLADFASAHPLGGKLASLVYYTQSSQVLYCDSDVLAFARPDEIEQALLSGYSCHQLNATVSYDPPTLNSLHAAGLSVPERLNSGILVCQPNTIDCQLVNSLVPSPAEMDDTSGTWWWIEQTIVAGMLHRAGATPLPEDLYPACLSRQYAFSKDVDTA
jgi:hypothetical protein